RQADDRVPRPRPEERHARATGGARAASQPDLGPVRPQPPRGPARRRRPGPRHARPERRALGAAWPRGGHDDPRRGRHASLLRRVGPPHGPLRERPVRRGTSPGGTRLMDARARIAELVCRSCLLLDAKDFGAWLALCDDAFEYRITT